MSEQKTHLIAVGLRLLFRFFLYSNRFIITIWIYLLRQKYYAAIIGAFTYYRMEINGRQMLRYSVVVVVIVRIKPALNLIATDKTDPSIGQH